MTGTLSPKRLLGEELQLLIGDDGDLVAGVDVVVEPISGESRLLARGVRGAEGDALLRVDDDDVVHCFFSFQANLFAYVVVRN